jgi:hypothetical protein
MAIRVVTVDSQLRGATTSAPRLRSRSSRTNAS